MIDFAAITLNIPRLCPACSDIDSFIFDEHRMKQNRLYLICVHCSTSFPLSDASFKGIETYPLRLSTETVDNSK